MSLLKKSPLCFLELTFDKKRLKILIMENLTKMKEIFNKLALVTMFVGSVLSFNSCGEKEQIHGADNPVEDQCVYCDDEKNDNSCVNGSECGCFIETIGNYKFPNFPEETGMIDEQAATILNNAKSYMNVILGDLNESLKGNSAAQSYFADYINNLNSIEYEKNNTTGIDPVINDLNEYHKRIFVEIVKNINTPLKQDRFIRENEAFDTKCYKDGFGSNFINDAVETYETQKSEVIRKWAGMHRVTGTEQPFDIEEDMNCGYTNISQDMDRLLEEAAANIGHGVTAEHLSIIKSGSNIIKYLDAKHDLHARALHNMSSCVSLETQGTIVNAMDEVKLPLTQTNMVMNERSL